MNEFKSDLRRAILSPPFWIAAAVMAVAVALGAGIDMVFPKMAAKGLVPYYHAGLIRAGVRSDWALMALPILCALPYTAAFLDEYESGYIRPYLMKCGQAAYVRGKAAVPAVAGGLCLVAGILAAYLLAALVYSPMELASQPAATPVMDMLRLCLVCFACGAVWAGAGALLANVSMSRHMAYASPFVLFYVLVMLSERYLPGLYVLNPKQWIRMENPWPLGAWGVALPALLLAGILILANGAVIEKRIKN